MAEIMEHKVDLLIKCDCGEEFRTEEQPEPFENVEAPCPECGVVHIVEVTIELEE